MRRIQKDIETQAAKLQAQEIREALARREYQDRIWLEEVARQRRRRHRERVWERRRQERARQRHEVRRRWQELGPERQAEIRRRFAERRGLEEDEWVDGPPDWWDLVGVGRALMSLILC
jgi:hypothetical protein